MAGKNLTYTGEQVEQRLKQGYYDDVKTAGYTGTKAQLDFAIANIGSGGSGGDLSGNVVTHTHDAQLISGEVDRWDGSIATSFSSGTGTEADPFIISTCAEFVYLRQIVGDGTQTAGTYYKITKNLDLSNILFVPIGGDVNLFTGHLDGGGYSIKNLNLSYNISDAYFEPFIQGKMIPLGLFLGLSYSSALTPTIKNLGILNGEVSLNVDIMPNDDGAAIIGVGGICGFLLCEDEASPAYPVLENCWSYVNVKATTTEKTIRCALSAVSGLVGFDRNTAFNGVSDSVLIKDCYYKGIIVSELPAPYGMSGCGIGLAKSQNCYVSCDIQLDSSYLNNGVIEEADVKLCIPVMGENVYYNKDLTDYVGPDGSDMAGFGGIGKITAEMQTAEFASLLGASFMYDSDKNEGFPMLAIQKPTGVYYDGYVREGNFNKAIGDFNRAMGDVNKAIGDVDRVLDAING